MPRLKFLHTFRATMMLLVMFMPLAVSAQTGTTIVNVSDVQTYSFSLPDNGNTNATDLLKGYVQQRFDEILPSYQETVARRAQRSAAAGLTGKDLNAYNYLKEVIKKIAAGEITNTVISIPLKEITSDVGPWTAADLGVSAIVSVGKITEEATKKASEKISFDFKAVIRALLADFPYELYWYDKTKGCTYKSCDGYSANNDQLSIKGDATFTMNVAQEYAVKNGLFSYYLTQFNAETVSFVNTSVANAKSIASSSTGSILNRITFYKDKICELTSYNTSAANSSSRPYGDPWQLVWVFDGDASTKVVCEGYAKAFKFLCDLSNFSNAECLLAAGKIDGGGHMWNVMKMDDGRSYMVDVTNCDEGTVGYPDKLFMAYGPSGSYSNGYTFQAGNRNVKYVYDDDTKANFGESELTISNVAYAGTETANYTIKADNITMEYGDNVPELTYTTTGGSISGSPYMSCEATSQSPVGTYPIVITQGSVTNGNVTYTNGTLTIVKAPLTISGGTYTIQLGEMLPTLTASYSGFKNNETESVLIKKPTLTIPTLLSLVLGTYDIIVSGAEAQNYEISYVKGTLTIVEFTGIDEVSIESPADIYYTLEGRKLQGKPTKKGIYIRNGKKVLIQ